MGLIIGSKVCPNCGAYPATHKGVSTGYCANGHRVEDNQWVKE